MGVFCKTELEIAKEYGIPLVATSHLLKTKRFDKKPLFSWVVYKKDGTAKVYMTRETVLIPLDKFEIIPAPQAHEISNLLPISFDYNNKGKFFYLTLEYITNKDAVLNYVGKSSSMFSQNGHLAEQYAQMWCRIQDLKTSKLID